jgi:ATP-dependent DNA ligase
VEERLIYPELLQDASDTLVQRLINDVNYVWQETHNGDRRIVEKSGDRVVDYNRHGERGKGLSPNIITALKQHPLHQFVIDCEFVGAENKLHVFDALHLGDYNIVNDKYRTRLQYVHASFDGFHPDILPIESAFTPEAKIALFERLQNDFAEGFVMKDLNAPYRQSNPSGTLRFNYRYKFIKTLDAVVIGDTQERDDKGMLKNSVRLGLYMPNGFLKDICGATKKSSYVLKPGDVVEIIYLYGTGTYDVVQPRINRLRDDKNPLGCTIDQIVVNKNWRKRA